LKSFIHVLGLFLIPIFSYCLFSLFLIPILQEWRFGPNTEQQISQSFSNAINKDYDILILGNSRIYRGINPDFLIRKAYNFSHDNDSYNQMFYKLKEVLKKKEIKLLIIGVDYFQFSFISNTRNYVYYDYFDSEYQKDFEETNISLKTKYLIQLINPKRIIEILKSKGTISILKENGQYIKPGIANEKQLSFNSMKMLPLQKRYFNEILKLCKLNNIDFFLLMPPSRKKELDNFTMNEKKKFNSFISKTASKFGGKYYNFSNSNDFSMSDFTDITHLNEKAADKFTKIVNDSIKPFIITSHP